MNNNKSFDLKLNFLSGVIYQSLTVVCGFIIPKLIIELYGSNVNGLLNSISQFLSVIAIMELGMGAVVPSSLYGPLLIGDKYKISSIYKSASVFYKKIATIFLIYVCILLLTYPHVVKTSFEYLYVVSLILIISTSTFVQYYFGCVDILLVTADQRGYVRYFAQAIVLVLNTLITVILLENKVSIQIVKLVGVVLFMLRPLMIRIYVTKKYDIDYNVEYSEDPIEQKRDGIIQHFAFFILTNTDIIILTLFSTLKNVSIYSIYFLIVNGIYALYVAATNGHQAKLGRLWAKHDIDELERYFKKYIYIVHSSVSVISGASMVLITPFINIYMGKLKDTGYGIWEFGVVMVLAYSCIICRLPQLHIVFAAGHYKETKWCFIITASVNIVFSILCVSKWGVIGVAIGTLLSMLIQEVWLMIYSEKHIISIGRDFYAKILGFDFGIYLIVIGMCKFVDFAGIINMSILNWVFAGVVVVLVLIVVVLANYLLIFNKLLFSKKEGIE